MGGWGVVSGLKGWTREGGWGPERWGLPWAPTIKYSPMPTRTLDLGRCWQRD